MKLVLSDIKLFKDTITIVSELVNEVTFNLNQDRLELVAIDAGNVAMVQLRILASNFTECDVDGEEKISINLANLKQILRRAKNDDTLSLSTTESQLEVVLQGKSRKAIEQYMRKINKVGADKYFIICTGHQGEPRAILSRIANGELPLNLKQDDMVLFSASVIPVEVSIENRRVLEAHLHKKGIRFFTDLHVSGHGHREDYREMLQIIKPKHIIPCHAGPSFAANFSDLAQQMGYKEGETIHIMENGKTFKLE